MTSRRMASALRAEAELLDACGGEQEALAAAKDAFAQDPTVETQADRRTAMQQMRAFRGWIRAVARIKQLREMLRTGLLPDGKPLTEEVREAVELELQRLETEWGPLIAEVEAMQSGPPPGPGDVQVTPQPVRMRARAMRPGGA